MNLEKGELNQNEGPTGSTILKNHLQKHCPDLKKQFDVWQSIISDYEFHGLNDKRAQNILNWYYKNNSYSSQKSRKKYSVSTQYKEKLYSDDDKVCSDIVDKFCFFVLQSYLQQKLNIPYRAFQSSFYDDITCGVDAIIILKDKNIVLGIDFSVATTDEYLLKKSKPRYVRINEFNYMNDLSPSDVTPRFVLHFLPCFIAPALSQFMNSIENGAQDINEYKLYESFSKGYMYISEKFDTFTIEHFIHHYKEHIGDIIVL
ncbi:hypothetical protein MK079_01075 [Candidatus Gracilibacteria bacterium]|nr:hypothetical protein [Candidatus Gracilibacteria bacterium]